MGDFEIRSAGGDALARLAKDLKGVDKTLRKGLLANLRAAGKPVVTEMKRNLRTDMPQAGGLARDLARARIGVRTRTSGDKTGVRIEAQHSRHDLEAVEAGLIRHPVFGRSGPWVTQKVPAGRLSAPVDNARPVMQRAILKAMENVQNEIGGR